MQDISVKLFGLDFPNPIIIGPSSLTNSFEKLKKLADAGAGGVITKLISDEVPANHLYVAKAVLTKEGVQLVGDLRVKLDAGVKMVKKAKDELEIPVITNTAGDGADLESWLKIALPLKDAGADALELDMGPGKLTNQEVAAQVIGELKKKVGLPLIMKMDLGDPNWAETAKAGATAGADAVSGPNALGGIPAPNIRNNFSLQFEGVVKQGLEVAFAGPGLNPVGLNFAVTAMEKVKIPLLSGGGVSTWENVVERISLGATAVTMVSGVYLKGLGVIKECADGLERYIENRNMHDIGSLRGVALKNYTDDVACVTDSPAEPMCVDPQNLWPNRLANDWWSSEFSMNSVRSISFA